MAKCFDSRRFLTKSYLLIVFKAVTIALESEKLRLSVSKGFSKIKLFAAQKRSIVLQWLEPKTKNAYYLAIVLFS